jgi:histidine triad (HIT) family protein
LQLTRDMENCIFCKIVDKSVPAKIWYSDEHVFVISDNKPLTPVHLLVIPRIHIASLDELSASEVVLAGRLLLAAKQAAQLAGIQGGYRVVVNTGEKGGQSVFHLHLHVLGGAPIEPSLITKGLK